MKNTVNLRLPVLFCLSLILGILCGYAALRTGISWLYFLLSVPVLSAIFIIISAVKRSAAPLIPFVLCAAFLVTGIIYSGCIFDDRSASASFAEESYVSGTVISLVIGDDEREIVLKNVTVDGAALDGKLLVTVTSYGGELCDEGDTVSFYAEVEKYDVITYGAVNSHVIEGVRYRCTVYAGLSAVSGFSLFGSVRSFIRNRLYSSLDSSFAGVAYAMMTGDTEGVEEGIMSSFRYGGVAHVFAVSGLHIGVIYGALLAVRKIFRLKGKTSQFVCLAAVLLYSGICGFTVSSVRAVIMCFVNAFARMTGNKYDILNSLSYAVILILLINPLDLFSAGFRLSVLSVAGIALFLAKFKKCFSCLPLKLGDGLAVSLSAQTGTLPAMLSAFGYLSGAGLLLNVFVLPVLSATFVLMLAGVILSAVIYPAAAAIISFCAAPLKAVLSVIVLCDLQKSVLVISCGALFIFLYYIFAALLSDKVKKSRLKADVLKAAAVATAAAYCLFALLYPVGGTLISVSAYYGGGYVLFKNARGSVLVVCGEPYDYKLSAYLASFGGSADVYVFVGDEISSDYILSLDAGADRAYVSGGTLVIAPDGAFEIISKDCFTEFGITFNFADSATLTVTTGGVKTGICAGQSIPEGCDLLIGDINFDWYGEAECAYTVNFSEGSGDWRVYSDGDKNFAARATLRLCIVF